MSPTRTTTTPQQLARDAVAQYFAQLTESPSALLPDHYDAASVPGTLLDEIIDALSVDDEDKEDARELRATQAGYLIGVEVGLRLRQGGAAADMAAMQSKNPIDAGSEIEVQRQRAIADIEPPVCPHCHTKAVLRPAKNHRRAFYGCPNFPKHPNWKFIVDAAKWAAGEYRVIERTSADDVFGVLTDDEKGGA